MGKRSVTFNNIGLYNPIYNYEQLTNEFKSFYKTVGGAEGNKCYYPTRLDPYGKGCYYNCKYCYAKKLLNFRKLWHPNDVAIANIEKIHKTIEKIPEGSTIRLGGMTDCFQPIEKKVKNTYNTILKLNEKGIHYLIVTKSTLIGEDEYMEILDPALAHIQISVPTTNNIVLKNTDNAPSFNERVRVIEKLQKNMYDVSIRLSPFLYETVNYQTLNKIKVDKCLVEFLRLTPQMKKPLEKYITFENYSLKEGGYRHLPLKTKLMVLNKLKFKELTVCDDVESHYQYFNRKFNPNPNDCCNLRP